MWYPSGHSMTFLTVGLEALTLRGEDDLTHIALYRSLKHMLRADGVSFRVPGPGSPHAFWDRALFLNLTYWDAAAPADVLVDPSLDADVLAHVAWHHAARKALGGPASADGLFLGEAVASAFDLYLIGRTLGRGGEFLESQVPAMAAVAEGAGMGEEAFEALLAGVADDPERAFEDLRALLFDAATGLVAARDVDAAGEVLEALEGRRFVSLLHHFELSNWVLFARAYASGALGPDPAVRSVDAVLRAVPVSLDWLAAHWLPEDPG